MFNIIQSSFALYVFVCFYCVSDKTMFGNMFSLDFYINPYDKHILRKYSDRENGSRKYRKNRNKKERESRKRKWIERTKK